MKYYLFFLLWLLVGSNLWGQHQQCQDLNWSGDVIYPDVSIELPEGVHNQVNYKLTQTRLNIRVALEKDGVYPYGDEANFDFHFDLLGAVKDAQHAVVLDAQGNPAQINSRVQLSESQPEIIYSIQIPNHTSIESANPYNLSTNAIYGLTNLEIRNTVISGTNGQPLPSNFQDNIVVEVCYEMDLKVDVGISTTTGFSLYQPKLSSVPMAVAGAAYYDFEWEALPSSATVSFSNRYSPFYEFQLLKLENTELLPEDRDDEKHIKTIVDWSKALSFIFPEEKIKHQGHYKVRFRPAQGKGYYLWRVRPIGSYYEGGVAQNQNWGQWSRAAYPLTNGYTEIKAVTSFDCFYYEDANDQDNYQYNRLFTEDGQVHEKMTYADKLLRPRQSQYYLPNENVELPGKTIVGQTLYDHLGRSSIAVMPVPVEGYMNGYHEKLVQNNHGDLYTLEDYGTDTKLYDPERVSTNGAYQYFSNDNVDAPTVPDAQGYPFTRTIYSNDGLNRVQEQSGFGKTHMVGTRASGRGRTTTTEIEVGVTDEELVSIFGAEAPNPDHVTKQIVTDPNGTTSISYISKSGKTLATAITDPYDPNADYPLGDVDHKRVNSLHLTEKLNLGKYQGDRFESSKTMILAQDVPSFKIDYQAPGCLGGNNSLPACLTAAFSGCSYEVTISLYKLTSTGNDPSTGTPVFKSAPTTVSGCNPVHIANLNLTKGTYKVIKEVKVASDNVNNLIHDYQGQVNQQIAAYMSLIGLLLDQVKTQNDWAKVDIAVEAIDDYLTIGTRDAAAQGLLQSALNGQFPGKFDQFNFSKLDAMTGSFGEVVIGMRYKPNLDPATTGFPNDDMDEIKLILQDCDGNSTELASEVQRKKDKFFLTQEAPYYYQPDNYNSPIGYDFPPFAEYFLDMAGLSLYDPTASNDFAKFFKGYHYWKATTAQWVPMDHQFLLDYQAARDGGNTANLKILNANQFNRMVWHMLNDQYYTGQVRYDDVSGSPTQHKYVYYNENTGNWEDFLANQNSLNEVQYEVQELSECWKQLVGVLEQMVNNSDSIKLPGDFDNSITNGGYSYTELKRNIPWVISFLFGSQLNKAMDNTTSGGGIQPFDNLPFAPSHLPQQFLKCAGTKYARIIGYENETAAIGHITSSNSPHSPTASMQFNTYDVPLNGTASLNGNYTQGSVTIPGYNNELEEYYGVYGPNTTDKERLTLTTGDYKEHSIAQFPFVQNPVFAFKYYEYWNSTRSGFFGSRPHPWHGIDNGAFTPQLSLQPVTKPFSCSLCESAYGYAQTSSTACNSSNFGHDEWPWQRRQLFLDCIQAISNDNGLGFPTGAVVHNSSTIRVDHNCTEASQEIPVEIATMEADCRTSCANRRAEFRAEVIAAFERSCWSVGQCVDQDPNYVTAAEIEAIVDQIVLECEGQCSLSSRTVSPTSCTITAGGVTIEYCNVEQLDECELMLREIAQYWKVELNIEAPTGVPCSGNQWDAPAPSVNNPPVCDPTTQNPNYYLELTAPKPLSQP